ncbi:MAG TPA: metallophosphatase domain-containing protein [Chitinophagaceae bacterium]|nr:metallophosphatase domain-containing protein [Chitinophagaceae bacterium]
MKIVAISDTHCRHQSVKLPKGDLLLHAGDITYKGELAEVNDFLTWFSKQPFQYKVFIAGNHDFYFEKRTEATIKALLPEGVIYLKDSGVMLNGIHIWGSPITPWFFNWAFNRHRGAAIAKHWSLIPKDTNLLVTHGPAFGILDTVVNGNHVGDKDLLKTILDIKPAVHLCGHVHESYGKTRRGTTQFLNASVLNEKYELVNTPLIFDL